MEQNLSVVSIIRDGEPHEIRLDLVTDFATGKSTVHLRDVSAAGTDSTVLGELAVHGS